MVVKYLKKFLTFFACKCMRIMPVARKDNFFLTKNTFVSRGKMINSKAVGKEEKYFDYIT